MRRLWNPIRYAGGDLLGIDIGSRAIKLAATSRSRGEWTLSLRQLIPVSAVERMNSDVLAESGISNEIQELAAFLKSQHKSKVGCVLSSSIVELQTVELPVGNDVEVQQMLEVEFAARADGQLREFDFFENEKVLDEKSGTTHWSVLSVPTDVATGVAESLWKQGLRCEKIETVPNLLSQAVKLSVAQEETEESVLAIDWGMTAPSLTLVHQGRPIYSRLLRNCGLQQFIDAGADTFGCSASQFCEFLQLSALQSREETANHTQLSKSLRELCSGVLEQLSQEIERTLSYIKQEYPSRIPNSLILFGGGAMIPGVTNLLQHKTRLTSSLWQLPASNRTNASIDPLQAVFANAILLSMPNGGLR